MTGSAQIHVLELGSKAYACAQIILAYGLKAMDMENPQLIRAMSGLKEGGGCSGNLCGALSGGYCLLGLYLGKGTDSEQPHEKEALLFEELELWFKERNSGKIKCDDILEGLGVDLSGGRQMHTGCGQLVAEVCEKSMELLIAHGIDPTERVE